MTHKRITSLILSTLLIASTANYAAVTPAYLEGVILNDAFIGVFETYPEGHFLVYGQSMTPVRKNKDGSLSKLTVTKGVSTGFRFTTDNSKRFSLIQGILYDANKKVILKGIQRYDLSNDLLLYDQNKNMSILRKSDGQLIQLTQIGLLGRDFKYTVKDTSSGTYYVFTQLSKTGMNGYVYKLGAKTTKKIALLNAPILDIRFATVDGQGLLLLHQKNQLTLYADQSSTYTYTVKARSYDWKMDDSQLLIAEAGKVSLYDLKTRQLSTLKGNYSICPAPFYNGLTGAVLSNQKALILDAQENVKAMYDYDASVNFPYSPTTVAAVTDQKTNETTYLWFGQQTHERYDGPLNTYLSCLLPNGTIQSIDLSKYLVYALGTQPSITDFDKLEDGSFYFKNDAKFPAFRVDAKGAFSYLTTQDSPESLLLKKLATVPLSKTYKLKDEKLINLYSGKAIPLETALNSQVTYTMTTNFLFVYTDWSNERTQDTMTAYDKLGNFIFTADVLESPYEAAELTPNHIYFVENETPYLYTVNTKNRTQLDHLIFSSGKNYHYTPIISAQSRQNLDRFYYVVGPSGNQIANLSGKLLDTSADYYVMSDDTHFTYSKDNLWGLIAVDENGKGTQLPPIYQRIVYQPSINAYIAKNLLGLSVALTLEGEPLIPGAYDQIDIYDQCIVAKSGSKTMLFQLAK